MKNNKYEIDMCNGTLMDKLISFALPLMLSGMLQLMFNAVDIIVVGRFTGSTALAAVGSTTALISTFTNLFIGVSLGANVLAARFYATGKAKEMSETVHTAIALAAISGVVMCIIGIAAAREALVLIDTPDDVIGQAALYLRLYFCGMPFFMLYNYGAAILRAVGDTKRPLMYLIIAGSTNAVLDLVLVIIFKMGVAGVAIGTVTSQLISCILVIRCLMTTESDYKLRIRDLRIRKYYLLQILSVGLPAGIQSTVINFSNVLLQSSVNSFGEIAMAGYTAANNILGFLYVSVNSITQACMSFTSQNYGAGDFQRCKKVYRLCMIFSVIFCGLLSGIFVLGRDFFLRLYTTDPNVLTFAVQRLLIVTTLELLTSTYEISGGAMRGFGHSLTPALITVVGSCVLRLIWINTVCRAVHEFWVVMIIYPISWVLTGTVMITAYLLLRRKLMR